VNIKTSFACAIGAVAFAAFLSAGWFATDAIRSYSNALDADSDARALEAVARLSELIAIQRGEYNVALAADDPVGGDLRKIIDKRIAVAQDAIGVATERLAQLDDSQQGLAADLAAAVTSANDVRLKVESAIALPKSQRDPSLAKTYTETTVAAMDRLTQVTDNLHKHVALTSPAAERRIAVARSAMTLRFLAGSRSLILSGSLLKNQPTGVDVLDKLMVETGKIEAFWRQIDTQIDILERPPELETARSAAYASYNSVMGSLIPKVLPGMRGESPYGTDLASYRTQASGANASLLPLRDAALDSAIAVTKTGRVAAAYRIFISAFMLLFSVGVCVIASVFFHRSVLGPISCLSSIIGTLAGGQHEVVVPFLERRDELGRLAEAVETLHVNGRKFAEMAVEKEAQASRDKKRAAEVEGLCASVDREFRSMTAEILSAAREVCDQARATESMALDVRQQASGASQSATEASQAVQAVAATTEQLSQSIAEISHQASRTADISAQAVGDVGRANSRIGGLSEASTRIGDVVRLVQDIASQTNLLALNATIEAARAGDAGKGFAVVAGEVKALASQTARAIEEIGKQIGSVQSVTGEVVESIGDIASIITRLNEFSTVIAGAAEQQRTATAEIVRNVHHAANGTTEVSHTVESVASIMVQTEQAAKRMMEQMEGLEERTIGLTAKLYKFLSEIRQEELTADVRTDFKAA